MVFRLTMYGEVVGYQRRIGGYTLYSRDQYGWNGAAIEFHAKEPESGFRDRNGERLFVNDLVRVAYYRNPVALRVRGHFEALIGLDDKGHPVITVLSSKETRPVDFLRHAVSIQRIGRQPRGDARN